MLAHFTVEATISERKLSNVVLALIGWRLTYFKPVKSSNSFIYCKQITNIFLTEKTHTKKIFTIIQK